MGLFDAYYINNLELRNRLVRSATFDGTADVTGAATDESVKPYRALGHGGVGLIVSGYAFVSPLGQALPGQYGIYSDAMVRCLSRIVRAAHEGGAKIAAQIVHAGNNTSYLADKGVEALAPSKVDGWQSPHRALTVEEIEGIIADFVAAARRAVGAGFDAVQLHGAHGYLMSQFLSPIFNRRTDQWGGSAENRRRFHLRVVEGIRREVGENYPLLIKYGVMDDPEGGLTLDEGLETAQRIVAAGVDAIEVSSGVGTSTRTLKKGDPERAYFRDRAAAVKRAVRVPIIAVAGIRSLDLAEDIIRSGDADLVSMCRPLIREPGLPSRWESGDTRPSTCISCNGCLAMARRTVPLRCVQPPD